MLKYTIEQVEALELAPGTEHEKLEGWVPELANENDLRKALEKAFDYRGDVTLTLKSASGSRRTSSTAIPVNTGRFVCAVLHAECTREASISYAEIARLEFSGKDRAAGKHWEDWVKAYNERKAAGEKNIALHPEALE